jgi:hypothetical protein
LISPEFTPYESAQILEVMVEGVVWGAPLWNSHSAIAGILVAARLVPMRFAAPFTLNWPTTGVAIAGCAGSSLAIFKPQCDRSASGLTCAGRSGARRSAAPGWSVSSEAQLGDPELFQVLAGQVDEAFRIDGLFLEDRSVFPEALPVVRRSPT